MTRRLHELDRPVRLGLALIVTTFVLGGLFALGLAAWRADGSPNGLLSPESSRLRYCAPPLERAIQTSMRKHIPTPERRALTRWVRGGAKLQEYNRGPARILDERCGSCHGQSPQAGIRLLTYADALELAAPGGRDPYRRRIGLHVHLFGLGALLGLGLLALLHTRFPRRLTLPVGLVPVGALLLTVPLKLWACHLGVTARLLWLGDALVLCGALGQAVLILWDLLRPLPG